MNTLTIHYSEDPGRTLAAALRPMASVAGSRRQCGQLVEALRLGNLAYALATARQITEECVPEPLFPHPQRAIVEELEEPEAGVEFLTPGGVNISIYTDRVVFDFNRDSRYLASSIIASVAMADRRYFTASFDADKPVVRIRRQDGQLRILAPDTVTVVVQDYDFDTDCGRPVHTDEAGNKYVEW